MATHDRPRVYLLANEETAPSVLFGLYDVLSTAGVSFPELMSGEPGAAVLDVFIAGRTRAPFRCVWNVLVEPHVAIDEIDAADALVVCDMYVPVTESPRGRYPAEVALVRRIAQTPAMICSVCSGSLVLADSGLLNGYESASHWAYHDVYRDYFPEVRLRKQDVLTVSGDGDRIVTAGGVSAWQDLALYLVARMCGLRQSVDVAKVHLLSGHEEGQLPYATMGGRRQAVDAVIADCQSWIAANYAASRPVSAMIERSRLNPRTFARRFQAATGYPPMEYVHALRVEEAKQYLETEDLPVDEIGTLVGYDDPAYFRRLFKRRTSLTPARYRRKFARFDVPSNRTAAAVYDGLRRAGARRRDDLTE